MPGVIVVGLGVGEKFSPDTSPKRSTSTRPGPTSSSARGVAKLRRPISGGTRRAAERRTVGAAAGPAGFDAARVSAPGCLTAVISPAQFPDLAARWGHPRRHRRQL